MADVVQGGVWRGGATQRIVMAVRRPSLVRSETALSIVSGAQRRKLTGSRPSQPEPDHSATWWGQPLQAAAISQPTFKRPHEPMNPLLTTPSGINKLDFVVRGKAAHCYASMHHQQPPCPVVTLADLLRFAYTAQMADEEVLHVSPLTCLAPMACAAQKRWRSRPLETRLLCPTVTASITLTFSVDHVPFHPSSAHLSRGSRLQCSWTCN